MKRQNIQRVMSIFCRHEFFVIWQCEVMKVLFQFRRERIYQRRKSMSSGLYRISICVGLLFLLMASICFAGTTGKIAGRVIEKENGEPLIGVNVFIKGSSLGGVTDIDGYYAILNVPPGTHVVISSMVGYSPVTVNDVRVFIDQTSPVDIKMSQQVIETGTV
ncbi:MAG: carboxypeptidase-like regulatory domain-containing protein, partial [Ignavibacteriae bacterium]